MLPLKPKQSNPRSFIQFAAMGSQMAVIMLVFIFLGRWLDDGNGHVYTLIGSIIGVVLAMYTMIKQILKP
jgi:ABC-type lipoprotein release transport system permease subunit